MALPSLAFDEELVLCRRCSREAEAERGSGKCRKSIVVSDAVEGTFVNLDGKSLQEESTRESGSGQQELIGLK